MCGNCKNYAFIFESVIYLEDDYCSSSDSVLLSGTEIMKHGIKAKDALHLACAIEKGCEYFITTDGKLTNKTIAKIKIVNPIDFVREMEEPT